MQEEVNVAETKKSELTKRLDDKTKEYSKFKADVERQRGHGLNGGLAIDPSLRARFEMVQAERDALIKALHEFEAG